jgi:hypothetical protein
LALAKAGAAAMASAVIVGVWCGGAAGAEPPVEIALHVDAETAVTGGALAFTARGFAPGETVDATLDGLEAPRTRLAADSAGAVTGALELAEGLRPGTHVLKVAGAVSGAWTEQEVQVQRAAAEEVLLPESVADAGQDRGLGAPAALAALAAVAVLVGAVAWASAALKRRRLNRHTVKFPSSP